jgi:hypothetical protein
MIQATLITIEKEDCMRPKMREFQFQAETKQLLNLVIHSLYTNKEIFLLKLARQRSGAPWMRLDCREKKLSDTRLRPIYS